MQYLRRWLVRSAASCRRGVSNEFTIGEGLDATAHIPWAPIAAVQRLQVRRRYMCMWFICMGPLESRAVVRCRMQHRCVCA